MLVGLVGVGRIWGRVEVGGDWRRGGEGNCNQDVIYDMNKKGMLSFD